jgi:hypothetical protein
MSRAALALALTVVAGFAALSMSGTAKASTTPGPGTGIVRTDFGGQMEEHVVPAALAEKINSGNWKGLSAAQLASAGVYPGMGGAAHATLLPAAASAKLIPNSGSGCNYDLDDDMCIYVQGEGLYVSSWDTQVVNNFNINGCTYAAYWVNGALWTTSNETCGNGDYWAYLTVDANFGNQTQLCNTWVNWGGRPCLTVHT